VDRQRWQSRLRVSGGQTKVTVTVDHHLWILPMWSKEEKVSSHVCHWFIGRVHR
jgi:hypothetical protein